MPAMDLPARPFLALLTRTALVATLAALSPVPSAQARSAPVPVVSFQDDAHDATGPGSYTPPGDTAFQEGDFDLRRFAVLTDGDDVLFVVTLGAAIRTPSVTAQTGSTPLELSNGIYLQNIDIYLDTDPTPGAGSSACIPGRRVTFADGRTWEAVVVLTPRPGPARAVTEDALGRLANRVHFAERLLVQGRTITARVPAAWLGGFPQPGWGYSVHVSGASWEQSYGVTSRFRGTHEADAFTMPVLTTPEAFAFGGAPMGSAHPRVVDVLLPPGADQAAVLGSFDARSGAFARVPFVYGTPPGPATATAALPEGTPPPAAPSAFQVVDVSGAMVTLSGPAKELRAMQLGVVLGSKGEPVARLVIIQVMEKGAVASAVEGVDRIVPGSRIQFEPPPRPASPASPPGPVEGPAEAPRPPAPPTP
jgi:carbohydrate-binding DOMON domain-containing protein